RLARLWVGPRSLPGQLTVLGPDAVWQGESAHLVAGDRGVDAHHVARDLLLHDGVGELVEHRVPERVSAQLEAVVGEPFHFRKSPLAMLTAPLRTIAEEVVAGGGAIEHAKDRSVLPSGMRLREVEPDADPARRVDLELPIAFDVTEL